MIKNILVLSDGTWISSGTQQEPAVMSCVYTESVNNGTELTLGSAVANSLEVSLFSSDGNFPALAGEEFTYYIQEDGVLEKVGVFAGEKPRRVSRNVMRITAYDRMIRFDRDMQSWLQSLSGHRNLQTFLQELCLECGVPLAAGALPNGDLPVASLNGNYSGRKLLEYAGQVMGRYARINADGELAFAWYTVPDEAVQVGASQEQTGFIRLADGTKLCTAKGNPYTVTLNRLAYLSGSLIFEDYQVEPVRRLQIRQNEKSQGVCYPDGNLNNYLLEGNPFLANVDASGQKQLAHNILRGIFLPYTPASFSLQATRKIRAGQILRVQDHTGRAFYTLVMNCTRKGQKMEISSTGSKNRASTYLVNHSTTKSINTRLENSIAGMVTVEDLRTEGNLQINAGNITSGILRPSLISAGILKTGDDYTFCLDFDRNTLKANFAQLYVQDVSIEEWIKTVCLSEPVMTELVSRCLTQLAQQ